MISHPRAVALLLLYLTVCTAFSQTPGPGSPVKILVITGGHPYDDQAFADVFRSMKTVSYSHAVLGDDAEKKLKPEEARNYDVLVFYDMYQKCEPYIADLISWMEQGKGVVFLHHALGSCAETTEYGFMIGGHARFLPPGQPPTASKFHQGTSYRAHIEDPTNPITAGMSDFEVTDEVYSNYFVNTDVHTILTTNNPLSGRQLAWTWQYKNSHVVYIELGHDHVTYDNPNYRRIVERAILWVGGRLPDATAQNEPGEKLYGNLGCAGCHGEDARGGRGPDLRSPALWVREDTEQHVFDVIKNGVTGAGMPSFAKMASDQEINELVGFLASSARGRGAAIVGDVNVGGEAYRTNCLRCHGPAGRGGLLGPELTSAVQSKDFEYLKHTIRHPDGEIPFNYAAISVITKDGRSVTGVRRNEDTFSLQMVDESGQLHLFEKDQLREVVHEKKPLMPGYDESQLPPDTLRNLLAYLQQEGKEK